MAKPAKPAVRSLSVVLPAFDEELNLDQTLAQALAWLPRVVDDFEIVVVNDGSRDGTQAVIDLWCERDPRVTGCTHPENRGYGAALVTGFRAARKEHVFFCDADGQFTFEDLPRLLDGLYGADMVTGYRASRRDGFLRSLNATAYNRIIVRGLFGCRVRDVNCAFKVFPRTLVRDAEPILSAGALINCEMLYKALGTGLTVAEVPVRHFPRIAGVQTGANASVILRMFKEAMRLWLKLHWTVGSPLKLGVQAALLTLAMAAVTLWGVGKSGAPESGTSILAQVGRAVPLSGYKDLDQLRHLDAQWYLDIAHFGYRIDPGQSNVVFFPLLPLLIRGAHELTGAPLPVAGHSVVLFFTLCAGVLMALFARELLAPDRANSTGDPAVAMALAALPLMATLAMLLHPVGVVLHALYPESLFLTLILGLLLAARRDWVRVITVCAFLLALTRPQGLFIPAAFWLLDGWRSFALRRLTVSRATVAVSAAVVAAVLCFAWHLLAVTGAPWSFWEKRVHWDANPSWTNLPRLLLPVVTKQFLVAKLSLYGTLAGAFLLWRRGELLPALIAALLIVAPLHKGDLGDTTRYSLLATFAWVPLLAVAARIPALLMGGFGVSAYLYGLFVARWLHKLWVG